MQTNLMEASPHLRFPVPVCQGLCHVGKKKNQTLQRVAMNENLDGARKWHMLDTVQEEQNFSGKRLNPSQNQK